MKLTRRIEWSTGEVDVSTTGGLVTISPHVWNILVSNLGYPNSWTLLSYEIWRVSNAT